MYRDSLKEEHGLEIANIVGCALDELEANGFVVSDLVIAYAINFYEAHLDEINVHDALTTKRRYIAEQIKNNYKGA